MTRIMSSKPASRRVTASSAVATATPWAPAATTDRATGKRAVAVAVGLDGDEHAGAGAEKGGQMGDVACGSRPDL